MTDRPDAHGTGAPSPWVARFLPAAPVGAPVLDLAAGAGRHARLARTLGLPAIAADKDVSRLADLAGDPRVEIVEADLEAAGAPWLFADRQFGAVVVVNYLHRPLFPALIGAVGPGGLLIYETFARGNEAFGRPRNPDFLLRRGELIEAVAGTLDVAAYEHGRLDDPGPRIVQRICARRSGGDSDVLQL